MSLKIVLRKNGRTYFLKYTIIINYWPSNRITFSGTYTKHTRSRIDSTQVLTTVGTNFFFHFTKVELNPFYVSFRFS